ncbi:YifB family Mg chelatase-like AAA ATPase [Emergencia sp.]|uniref:YifB family Mg chelatase-like AAA ATPase n=1 Tax=Emergencia sp. TaxID=1926557 RepID=UPI003AF144CF
MLSKTISAAVHGIDAVPITVETDICKGMPVMNIVGLGDRTVKEARERIRAAICNSGLQYPMGRITINMSPAGMRKRGSHFDLAMMMGILASSKQVFDRSLEDYGFIGELSLDGCVKQCDGILPMVTALRKQGLKNVMIPKANREEAALVNGINLLPVESIAEVLDHFNLKCAIAPYCHDPLDSDTMADEKEMLNFADVKGQENVKRAITVAVAGGHGILMVGSPSTGKTMISERIPSIMPKMNRDEIIETTMIYSVAGLLNEGQPYICRRPFRQPHHKITAAGLLGGGAFPRPGEITLADKGVLFLDEIGEFDKNIIDTLRIPLEKKKISLIRKGESYVYPADFMLVAATNPCKCGYYGDAVHECVCRPAEISSYQSHLTGPIMDRIDMHIRLLPVDYNDLNCQTAESSEEMKQKIEFAREIQHRRYQGRSITLNHQLDDHLIEEFAFLSKEQSQMLEQAYSRFQLNPRTVLKIRKMARTVADLDGDDDIQNKHLAEALQYREKLLCKENF